MAYVIRGNGPDPPDRIEIQPSARRHGISDERILHVVSVCPEPRDNPMWRGQMMYLAPDQHGNPLEVMGVIDDDGVLWVVHAMRLRPAYAAAYQEVNGHR